MDTEKELIRYLEDNELHSTLAMFKRENAGKKSKVQNLQRTVKCELIST